jgi:hypothetical protein
MKRHRASVAAHSASARRTARVAYKHRMPRGTGSPHCLGRREGAAPSLSTPALDRCWHQQGSNNPIFLPRHRLSSPPPACAMGCQLRAQGRRPAVGGKALCAALERRERGEAPFPLAAGASRGSAVPFSVRSRSSLRRRGPLVQYSIVCRLRPSSALAVQRPAEHSRASLTVSCQVCNDATACVARPVCTLRPLQPVAHECNSFSYSGRCLQSHR